MALCTRDRSMHINLILPPKEGRSCNLALFTLFSLYSLPHSKHRSIATCFLSLFFFPFLLFTPRTTHPIHSLVSSLSSFDSIAVTQLVHCQLISSSRYVIGDSLKNVEGKTLVQLDSNPTHIIIYNL